MKNLVLFAFIVFSVISVFAGPKFEPVEGQLINTGNHIRGKEVIFEMHFRNAGDEDLVISNVSTTCGCSSALLSHNTLKPGDEGLIKFTFNGQGMGKVQKVILVNTNDETGIHSITFEMNMVDPVTLSPSSVITQGKKGDEIHETAVIQNTFDKDVVIKEITTNTPAIKVSSDKMTIAQNEAAVINIDVKIYEDSPVNGAVFISTTEGDFQIPVFVDVQAN